MCINCEFPISDLYCSIKLLLSIVDQNTPLFFYVLYVFLGDGTKISSDLMQWKTRSTSPKHRLRLCLVVLVVLWLQCCPDQRVYGSMGRPSWSSLKVVSPYVRVGRGFKGEKIDVLLIECHGSSVTPRVEFFFYFFTLTIRYWELI